MAQGTGIRLPGSPKVVVVAFFQKTLQRPDSGLTWGNACFDFFTATSVAFLSSETLQTVLLVCQGKVTLDSTCSVCSGLFQLNACACVRAQACVHKVQNWRYKRYKRCSEGSFPLIRRGFWGVAYFLRKISYIYAHPSLCPRKTSPIQRCAAVGECSVFLSGKYATNATSVPPFLPAVWALLELDNPPSESPNRALAAQSGRPRVATGSRNH